MSSLNFLGRLLWVGLIVTCADDQGRLINNPKLIRSDVFPLDDIPVAQIQSAIQELEQGGSIITYEAGGKSLIQLVNWWRYQSPSWAMPSRYPAPDGWNDSVKARNGAEVYTINWGPANRGFDRLKTAVMPAQPPDEIPDEIPNQIPNSIPSEIPIQIPISIPNPPACPTVVEVVVEEIKVKGEIESSREEAATSRAEPTGDGLKSHPNPAATAAGLAQFGGIPDESFAERVYCQATGLPTIPSSIRETAENMILSLRSKYPHQEELIKHLKGVYARWCGTRGRNGKAYSRLGSGWLEWALEDPAQPAQAAGKTRSGLSQYTPEELAEMRKALNP